MAWNTPGSDNSGDNRPSRQRKPPGRGLDSLIDSVRGLFGGGGAGSILRWVGVLVALWLAFNCFVLVTEQERGVVLRFGTSSRVLQPGPHFKLPWPIESVQKVNATQSKAYSENVPVLTRDGNMVNVEINVQYRIESPTQYLFGSREPEEVLKQAAQSAVREQIGRSDLDTVLGARSVLTTQVRQRLQSSLKDYETGLTVTELNLPNARPPDEVKDAFDEAQRANADKSTAINEAQAYAKKIVPEARGDAQRIRTTAEGYKTSVVARAQGDAARFSLLVEQYKGAPEVTRKRLWLDAVQEVLSNNRKIVGGDSRQILQIPLTDRGGVPVTPGPVSVPLAQPELLPSVTATDSSRSSIPYSGRPERPKTRDEVMR
ncbi:FtsH protease activity modulator HflK [Lysobacter enzymogenes]|uniref:Protein HflK n=1 Tax=Lysobacter enzymogenes TaxID=69 RepID=A0A1P7YD90_LYSEN|nr:FtsH protease activity modulator HflK [Lysobacter enzymogenes]AKA63410.1 HflK [Lysobacter enzymogenes]ROU05367.1 FtsH protease activity modulator HflK [Lysobacter enzymogenes]